MISNLLTMSSFLLNESSSGDALTTAATTAVSGSDPNAALGGCSTTQLIPTLILYGAIGLVFYFLIYRPQKKRRQQEEALRSNVEIGDEIVTIGGICGRIVSVKEDDTIVIEIGADRTKLKMKSWCISSNESAKERADAQKPAEKKKFSLFGKKEENK